MSKINTFVELSQEGYIYYLEPDNNLLVHLKDGEKDYLIDDNMAVLISPRGDKIPAIDCLLGSIEFIGEL